MSKLIEIPTYTNQSGSLSVIEKILPFEIKRFYYIYNVNELRGGHRHKKTVQALIAIGGSCEIYVDDGIQQQTILLDSPNKCLILDPRDWHTMDKFTKGAVLMVLASEYYDVNDYIDDRY